MTPEKAIACIDEVLISTVNYDESLEYELSSYDIDWLEEAREALVQKTEYDKISRSVKEFWSELEKLRTVKGKDKPTLEELLEYMEALKDEAIIEFAERLKTEAKLRNHTNYGANKQAVSYNEGVIETRKFMLVCIDTLVKEKVADAKIATTTETEGDSDDKN